MKQTHKRIKCLFDEGVLVAEFIENEKKNERKKWKRRGKKKYIKLYKIITKGFTLCDIKIELEEKKEKWKLCYLFESGLFVAILFK